MTEEKCWSCECTFLVEESGEKWTTIDAEEPHWLLYLIAKRDADENGRDIRDYEIPRAKRTWVLCPNEQCDVKVCVDYEVE